MAITVLKTPIPNKVEKLNRRLRSDLADIGEFAWHFSGNRFATMYLGYKSTGVFGPDGLPLRGVEKEWKLRPEFPELEDKPSWLLMERLDDVSEEEWERKYHGQLMYPSDGNWVPVTDYYNNKIIVPGGRLPSIELTNHVVQIFREAVAKTPDAKEWEETVEKRLDSRDRAKARDLIPAFTGNTAVRVQGLKDAQ